MFIRRTYTCPFFSGNELGCLLDSLIKPYGCLAFNFHGATKEGVDCYSKEVLLEEIEDNLERKKTNAKVKELLGLNWEKAYIPIGIKDVALRFLD